MRDTPLQTLAEGRVELGQEFVDDILDSLNQLGPLLDEPVGTTTVVRLHESRYGKDLPALVGGESRGDERPALDRRFGDHHPEAHPADNSVPARKMNYQRDVPRGGGHRSTSR